MAKKKKNKPKFNQGTPAPGEMNPYAQIAGIGAGFIPQDNPMGGAASGALSGAAQGAAFGPIGAGVGAVVGGAMGFAKGGKAQKAQEQAESMQKYKSRLAGMSNAQQVLPTYASGGEIGKPNVIKGGKTTAISPDAVQVVANDPSQTDSVELDTAYVDHNEIIDNKDRVFSDVLKAPSGRSIAKEAKRLEKMKSTSSRFTDANSMIDSKLDALFGYQQRLNMASNKPKKALGGTVGPGEPEPKAQRKTLPKGTVDVYRERVKGKDIKPIVDIDETDPVFYDQKQFSQYYRQKAAKALSPEDQQLFAGYSSADADAFLASRGGTPDFETYIGSVRQYEKSQLPTKSTLGAVAANSDIPNYTPEGYRYSKGLPDKDSITKTGYKKGGKLAYDVGGPLDPFGIKNKKPPFQPTEVSEQFQYNSDPFSSAVSPPTAKKQPFDWNKAGTMAATYGSDILNTFLTSKMQGPKAPALESATFLNRVNADDQLAENRRQTANTNRLTKTSIAQPTNASAVAGASLAKRLYADNQVRGDANRLNAQIGVQEAQLNQGVKARNANSINQYNNQKVGAYNQKLSAYSQIGANVAEKTLLRGREKNQQELDLKTLDVLKKKYEDSGVYNRNEFDEILNTKLGKKKNNLGGYLHPKKKGKMKC